MVFMCIYVDMCHFDLNMSGSYVIQVFYILVDSNSTKNYASWLSLGTIIKLSETLNND